MELRAADRAADVQQAQITVAPAVLTHDIKAAYLKLAYLHQISPLFEASRNTLEQVIQTESAPYRTAQGQADVLKAQLERTKLIREITMHHEDIGQADTWSSGQMNKPKNSMTKFTSGLTDAEVEPDADEPVSRYSR